MVAFTKYQELGNDLLKGVHNYVSHEVNILLAAVAYTPAPTTDSTTGNVTELAAQSGYTANKTGKAALHVASPITEATGVWSLKAIAGDTVNWNNTGTPAWTAGFKEVVAFNVSVGTANAHPLLGYWDQSTITLAGSATFTVTFTTSKILSVNTA